MPAVSVTVAGVTKAKAHYPWALLWLAERVRADSVEPVTEVGMFDPPPAPGGERCEVLLVREPRNPHDANAVRVEVPALADGGFEVRTGYLPAVTARVFAARLDAGERPVAWVRSIPVRSPTDLTPGLTVYVDWPTL